MEIAEFIALMREQEAADDEEEYWLTHPVARFKRRLWSKIRGVDPRAAAIAVSRLSPALVCQITTTVAMPVLRFRLT
jgi:hypothetical protein